MDLDYIKGELARRNTDPQIGDTDEVFGEEYVYLGGSGWERIVRLEGGGDILLKADHRIGDIVLDVERHGVLGRVRRIIIDEEKTEYEVEVFAPNKTYLERNFMTHTGIVTMQTMLEMKRKHEIGKAK